MTEFNIDNIPYEKRIELLDEFQTDIQTKQNKLAKQLEDQRTVKEKNKIEKLNKTIISLLISPLIFLLYISTIANEISFYYMITIEVSCFVLMSITIFLMLYLYKYEKELKPILIYRLNSNINEI